jgi:hypothetical protein
MLSQALFRDKLNRLRVIQVEQPLVLYGQYDRDQMWLPFMAGVVVLEQAADPAPPGEVIDMRARLKRRWFEPTPEDRRIYQYEANVHQHVLPFAEHQKVSTKDWKRLAAAEFPAWKRQGENLLLVEYPMTRETEAREWCAENCWNRYMIARRAAVFERCRDAALFKMMFHTGS